MPARPGDPLAGAARAVLHEAGPAGPEPPRSRFLLVLDRERVRPAGAMRYADDGEVRTFTPAAVLPQYRGKRSAVIVGTLLYRALYTSAAAAGIRRLETAMDRAGYRAVRLIGLPLRPAGESGSGGSRPAGESGLGGQSQPGGESGLGGQFRPAGESGSGGQFRPAGESGSGDGDLVRLAGDVAGFERSVAEQAARLRRAARPGGPEVRRVDPRTLAERRIGADIARRLATGDGLDEHILNPA